MNKKIPIAIGAAVVIIGIIIVGSKAYFGDSATELPGEEKVEKSLNLQESSNTEAGEAKTGEIKAGEAKIGEANEAGEANEPREPKD